MNFKFLLMFCILYNDNFSKPYGSWRESDEESLYRQITLYSLDQMGDTDYCQKKLDFKNNNALISKNIYIFNKDYFTFLDLEKDIMVYFRKYDTQINYLYKYKNDYYVRYQQCLLENEKINKNDSNIFLQDSGSGFSKISHKLIYQSNYATDIFVKEKYIQEIFMNFSCMAYSDKQLTTFLNHHSIIQEVVKHNGKYYYAMLANFYDQDFIRVSLAVEYHKYYTQPQYDIFYRNVSPCVYYHTDNNLHEEQKDAFQKSQTKFPVQPLKTYIMVELNISDEDFLKKRYVVFDQFFDDYLDNKNTEVLLKVFNQFYYKQAQAALYLGLNLTCGMFRRCLIDTEKLAIHFFYAQQINGDPKEGVKFLLSPFVKNFLIKGTIFINESEENFIGPFLQKQHFLRIDKQLFENVLQLLDDFLVNYFAFGGYILGVFQKIDLLLQEQNWIEFNKIFFTTINFIAKSQTDDIYTQYADKQLLQLENFLKHQNQLIARVLEIRKYNKSQLQKKQNQELETIIVDVYKKILSILYLNQKVNKLKGIDNKLSYNLTYLIQKEIQMNEKKIDHNLVQESFKKYFQLNIQNDLQKSLFDLLDDLSFSIDDKKKKDLFESSIGTLQNVEKILENQVQKQIQKQEQPKKNEKNKHNIIENKRLKKDLNLFLLKRGLIKDLPDLYKQNKYDSIKQDKKNKQRNANHKSI